MRRRVIARMLLITGIASAIAAGIPTPAPAIYCDRGDPVCLALAVACQAINTAHNKFGTKPECNLA